MTAPDRTPKVSVSRSSPAKHVVSVAGGFRFVLEVAGQHCSSVHQQFLLKILPAHSPVEMQVLSVVC